MSNPLRKLASSEAANLATVGAAAITAVTVLFSGWQFIESQKLAQANLHLQAEALSNEREAKAIELFQKFNEQQQELASKALPKRNETTFWHHNGMLTTTEAVFRLTEGDPGWTATVEWMLQVQEPFLRQTEFRCESFAKNFLAHMRRVSPTLRCEGMK